MRYRMYAKDYGDYHAARQQYADMPAEWQELVASGQGIPAVLAETDRALTAHELIKIRLDHDRHERAVLAGKIAEVTGTASVMQVGKVAVFYRPKPTPPTASG